MLYVNKSFILVLLAILLLTLLTPAQAMERRRDQFLKEPGHYLVPVPYSYPGIGEGVILLGVIANAHDSYTDYGGFVITGDVEGFGAVATDIHLIDKTLLGEVAMQDLSKVAINSYNGRGMDTDKDDYSLLEFDDIKSTIARLRGTFYERMFEVAALAIDNQFHLTSLRDRDGHLIQDTRNSETIENQVYSLSFLADWTDDYQDPRKGLRYGISRWWTNEDSPGDSDSYLVEHNLTAYIPIGRISTWAFNYFRSDAIVTRRGDTDFASVENRLGLDCDDPGLTTAQRSRCEQVVNNSIANNRHGTAANMGGVSRLRSYPEGRYKGAHAVFYGTEIRWNLTEEFQPFNIGIAKDIRTGIQLSFFWETASVADEKDKLGDIWRDSYGAGIRFVMTSGIVFRAEIADGDEGSNIVMFFNYPWADY